jgi:AraC-like DNA-binding protein
MPPEFRLSLDSSFPFFLESIVGDRPHVLSEPWHQLIVLHRGRCHCHGRNPAVAAAPAVVASAPDGKFSLPPKTRATRFVFDKPFLDEALFACSPAAAFHFGGPGQAPRIFSLAETQARRTSLLVAAMVEDYRVRSLNHRELLRLQFAQLLVLLGESEKEAAPARPVRPARWNVDDVVAYVREHYAERTSLDELAERCGVNPTHLSRSFRQTTGTPLFEFINRIRIQKACGLLKRTDLTVLEIAVSVGYNNVSFFNRYFRKLMRMSPREYRAGSSA